MKKELNNIEKELSNKLQECDVLGLISGGAPKDEYDFEIPQIMKIIEENKDVDSLAQKLHSFYQGIQSSEVVGGIKKFTLLSEKLLELK